MLEGLSVIPLLRQICVNILKPRLIPISFNRLPSGSSYS